PMTSGGSTYWSQTGGWVQRSLLSGRVNYSESTFTCYPGDGSSYHYTVWANFTYTDGAGTVHTFSGLESDNDPQGFCGCVYSSDASADDGTQLDLNANVQPGFHTVTSNVYYPDGTALLGFNLNDIGAASAQDRNGNEITVAAGSVTDTLNTTVESSSEAGCPNCAITLTFTGPQGNVTATEKYTASTLKTNFGCSGISETTLSSFAMLTEIDLPDSSKYQFTYEATPGYAGDITGRIASITLPTGGQINYTYSGGSNGITCADGGGATLTRQTPDGSWTYTRTQPGGASYYQTTVQDPAGNQTLVTTQTLLETERDIYSGTVSGGTLL